MIRTIIQTWGVVARRMASDRLMLAAAAITILLATTLLAAGPIYADAVNVASLRRTLEGAPFLVANLEITARGQAADHPRYEQSVRQVATDAFNPPGVEVVGQIEASAFEISLGSDDRVDLASIQWLEGVQGHATLVDGTWPTNGPSTPQLAVQQSAADRIGLAVGDEVTLQNRRDASDTVTAVISGIFRAADAQDPYWHDDQLIGTGQRESASFLEHGPFLADRATIGSVFGSTTPSTFSWRVYPNHDALGVGDIAALRRSVGALQDRLNASLEEQTGVTGSSAQVFTVTSELGARLREAEQSIEVTRSNVLMLSVQLAVIAGYALMLTSGLLVEGRKVETGLLRSRGASNGQLLAVSVMEGIILTLPAALLAPWLAAWALNAFNHVGPLASIGLGFEPEVNRTSYVLAAVAAGCCMIALAIPALRSSRTFNESNIARGREKTRGIAQRVGLDLALLAVALVAFWQLRTRGIQISSTVRGRFGVDPLLVAAPALALLAGGALALRAVPLLARFGEKLASKGRGTVPALSAWQVARRPLRYARASLLLIMAVAFGLFAASYSTTWASSQADQATFEVGTDLRVSPGQLSGSIEPLQLGSAHDQVAGLIETMPVHTVSGQLTAGGMITRTIALDAAVAADVVALRGDLSSTPFDELMRRLRDDRPAIASLPLPGEPQTLAIVVSAIEAEPCEACADPRIRVVLQDGDGLLHRLDMGVLTVDQEQVEKVQMRLEVGLVRDLDGQRVATPRYPISLIGIEIAAPVGFTPPRDMTVALHSMEVSDTSGDPEWSSVLDPDTNWVLSASTVIGGFLQPKIQRLQDGSDLNLALTTVGEVTDQIVYFGMRPGHIELPDTISAVVTGGFLTESGRQIGEIIRLDDLRIERDRVRLVGELEAFPTVPPDSANVVIVDLASLQIMGYEPGSRIDGPSEYWVTLDVGASAEEELRQAPFDSMRVVDRAATTLALQTDPIALGSIAALSLGFTAAALLAAVGFIVSAVASARERVNEFTLLRALGLSSRQLGVWLTLEQAILVALGLFFGTLVGLGLVGLVLPLITVTQEGSIAFPDPAITYPITAILALDAAVILALVVVVMVLSVVVRRQRLASQIRMGQETG